MLMALLKAAHVLAVVVWVGGMAFAHFCLRPSLGLLDPPARVKLMHAVMGRFFSAVLWAAGVILITGLWMVGRAARQAVQSGGQFHWPLDWVVMTVVGLLMVALFGHIRFVLFKRLSAAVQAADVPAAAAAIAAIRPWVALNLGLGLALIALVTVY